MNEKTIVPLEDLRTHKTILHFLGFLVLLAKSVLFVDCVCAMALQVPSTALTLHPEGGGSFSYRGRSRAGDGTSFVLQELKWMFDMGALVHQQKPDVVCLTHTHNDHITFMAQILTDTTRHTDVYLPAKALPFARNFLKSHQEMIDCGEESESIDDPTKHYTLHPLDFGDIFDITIKGTKYTVTALKCRHRVDCLGFSIFRTTRALKPEYQGLEGREIGKLRKDGVEIHDISAHPFLCHLGDTTHVVFDNHPEILQQHKFIVVECTFFCEKTRKNAENTMHMHWDDLKPIVESNPEVLFILIHFSLRYSALTIREFFVNATTTKNVHPMLVESELRPQFGGHRHARAPRCTCFHCEEFHQRQEAKRAAKGDADNHSNPSRRSNHYHKRQEKHSDKLSDNRTRGERNGNRED